MTAETKRSRLGLWTGMSLGSILLLAAIQRAFRDDGWFSAWLLEMPQQVFMLFPLGVFAACLLRRQWRWVGWNCGVLLLAGILLFDFRWTSVESSNQPKLRVMTYNVYYALKGIPGLAETILSENPDVIFFQESAILTRPYSPQQDLLRALPGYQAITDGEIMIASRLPIRKVAAHPMPAEYPHRPLLEGEVTWQGQKIRVIAAHMQPNATKTPPPAEWVALPRKTRKVLQIREGQWQLVRSVIGPEPRLTLFGGDLNGTPKQRFRDDLRTAGMQDAFDEAGRGFGFTINSSLPLRRIDSIWAGKGLRAVKCKAVKSKASDHRPVVAEFQLSDQPQVKNPPERLK